MNLLTKHIHFQIWLWQVHASSYNSNKLTNQMQQFYKFITWRFVSLNMFRAPPCPSSGAYNCINNLWFYLLSKEVSLVTICFPNNLLFFHCPEYGCSRLHRNFDIVFLMNNSPTIAEHPIFLYNANIFPSNYPEEECRTFLRNASTFIVYMSPYLKGFNFQQQPVPVSQTTHNYKHHFSVLSLCKLVFIQ